MAKSLTTLQRKAVRALTTNTTISQAAEAAGCSRRSIYTWLKDPQFLAELHALEDAGASEFRRTLAIGRTEALKTLLHLMKNAKSENVRHAAAATWLGADQRQQDRKAIDRLVNLEEQIYGNQS